MSTRLKITSRPITRRPLSSPACRVQTRPRRRRLKEDSAREYEPLIEIISAPVRVNLEIAAKVLTDPARSARSGFSARTAKPRAFPRRAIRAAFRRRAAESRGRRRDGNAVDRWRKCDARVKFHRHVARMTPYNSDNLWPCRLSSRSLLSALLSHYFVLSPPPAKFTLVLSFLASVTPFPSTCKLVLKCRSYWLGMDYLRIESVFLEQTGRIKSWIFGKLFLSTNFRNFSEDFRKWSAINERKIVPR